MKTSTFLAVSLSSFFLPLVSAGGCPTIVTSNSRCSESVFGGKGNLTATCASDGSTVTIGGTVTVKAAFNNGDTVTAVPCIWGMCWEKYAQDLGGFCTYLTNDNGDACGTAGTYTLTDHTINVPNNSMVRSMMGTATVKVYLGVKSGCSIGIGSRGSSSAQLVSMAAVPLIGIALVMGYRRRRRPLLNLDGGDEHFVEMNDVQTNGQMV